MVYFFHTYNNSLRSTLTIPKFTNQSKRIDGFKLFAAYIDSGKWITELAKAKELENFWIVDEITHNKNEIYFIASAEEAKRITESNQLLDLNTLTDTYPNFRANLKVQNEKGAFSSYQSDYPYYMTQKLGSLYSDCGMLTTSDCVSVGVFLKSVFKEPISDEREVRLYDQKSHKVLQVFKVRINDANYIDLTPLKDELSSCILYADEINIIPIFVIDYADGSLSFEHTHAPHEFINGNDRYELVKKMKKATYEKAYL